MNYLSNSNINNKRVLLRCDYNVPVKDDVILDDSKIINSLDTINYLLNNNNTVIIFSHFGRVKKEEDKQNNSLKIVFDKLKNYLDIEFIENPLNLEIINNSSKKCFLVENTRFTDVPSKKESLNDLDLAKYWSTFGDVFVIDAFASLHRVHSSTAGISNFLKTYIGFLVEKEITNLNVLVESKNHPFAVIMGGAKVDDKIKLIESLIEKCDKLILTGGILNSFLYALNRNVGNSLVSTDEEVLESIKRVIKLYKNKIFFSNSFIVDRDGININTNLDNIEDNDIIYDNIPNIDIIIENSNIIFLNGTCGKYEINEYSEGTKKMLESLSKCDASVYIGGGDTVSSVKKFNHERDYTYLSTGGGATLEYVAYGKLKALEYIEERNVR